MIDIKDFQLSLDELGLALSEFSDDGSVLTVGVHEDDNTAHWLYVFFGSGDNGGGLVVSPEARLNIAGQSVRDESVQYRVAQMMDAGNDWLTYSVYGQMFYDLRKGTMGARIV